MLALAFALLLSLASPPPAATATVAASPAPPQAAALPSPGPDDVLIENSGSTNTAGYRIILHSDATADIRENDETVHAKVDPALVASFVAKLRADGPLASLGGGHCMRSVSFGSSTRVAYHGESTGDLSCGASPEGRDLLGDARAIASALGVTTFRARRFPL
jgi:hypothetical protein